MDKGPLQHITTARVETRNGTIYDDETYKVVVVTIDGTDYTLKLSQPSYDGDVIDVVCDAINLADRSKEASLIVQEAVNEADRICQAQPVGYSDYGINPRRHHTDTRPYTLKDAKSQARYLAARLRRAWDLLDPPLSTMETLNGSKN